MLAGLVVPELYFSYGKFCLLWECYPTRSPTGTDCEKLCFLIYSPDRADEKLAGRPEGAARATVLARCQLVAQNHA